MIFGVTMFLFPNDQFEIFNVELINFVTNAPTFSEALGNFFNWITIQMFWNKY